MSSDKESRRRIPEKETNWESHPSLDNAIAAIRSARILHPENKENTNPNIVCVSGLPEFATGIHSLIPELRTRVSPDTPLIVIPANDLHFAIMAAPTVLDTAVQTLVTQQQQKQQGTPIVIFDLLSAPYIQGWRIQRALTSGTDNETSKQNRFTKWVTELSDTEKQPNFPAVLVFATTAEIGRSSEAFETASIAIEIFPSEKELNGITEDQFNQLLKQRMPEHVSLIRQLVQFERYTIQELQRRAEGTLTDIQVRLLAHKLVSAGLAYLDETGEGYVIRREYRAIAKNLGMY